MKKFVLILIVLISVIVSSAALDLSSIDESKYYVGKGTDKNGEKAKKKALDDLLSQIAVTVSSSFSDSESEKDGEAYSETSYNVKMFSLFTFKNLKYSSKPCKNGIQVFCYASREDVRKSLENRKEMIKSLYCQGKDAESIGNYKEALRSYYHALVFVNSVPDIIQYGGKNLKTEIPSDIRRIISGVNVKYISCRRKDRERKILLSVQVDGRDADIDFTVWTGSDELLVNAKNGKAYLSLFGSFADSQELIGNIKYNYEYGQDYEMKSIWESVEKPEFDSQFEFELREKREEKKKIQKKDKVKKTYSISQENLQEEKPINLSFKYDIKCPVKKRIESSALDFVRLLRKGNKSEIERHYSYDSDLKKKILDLIEYNSPEILLTDIEGKVDSTLFGWEFRSVPVACSYSTLGRNSTSMEYLVLDFDKEGNFNNFTVGLMESLYDKLISECPDGERRIHSQTMLKFLEKYRTAFLVRDVKTLDLLFSDDALIIVGKEIKRDDTPGQEKPQYIKLNKNNPDYEYIEMSKNEYLDRLSKVFNRNTDLFLNFSTLRFQHHNKDKKKYGVEMRQNYNSTGYSDEGYLFLLINFKEENPKIFVRAWQPNEWLQEALVKFGNFNVNE